MAAWTLRENPRDRPNIYKVVKAVSILRGSEIPIRDVFPTLHLNSCCRYIRVLGQHSHFRKSRHYHQYQHLPPLPQSQSKHPIMPRPPNPPLSLLSQCGEAVQTSLTHLHNPRPHQIPSSNSLPPQQPPLNSHPRQYQRIPTTTTTLPPDSPQ